MSKFSASDAAFVGFRLVREHPRAVAVWAVLMTVLSLMTSTLTIQLAGPQLNEFMALSADNSAAPEEMLRIMGGLAPLMVFSVLYSLALYAVTLAAVNRIVLRPDDSRSAFLRFGADELRQAGTLILVNLIFLAVYILGILISAVLIGVGVAAGGGPIAGLTGLVSFVGVALLMIFVAVRLSFASTLTFDTGRIAIRASWAMTKGHVGALLGAYLLAVVMAVIVYLLVMTIVAAIGVIASGGITGLGGLFEPDMSSLETFFTPIGITRALFAGVISVLTSLIVFSPAPEIYRILKAGGVEPVATSV